MKRRRYQFLSPRFKRFVVGALTVLLAGTASAQSKKGFSKPKPKPKGGMLEAAPLKDPWLRGPIWHYPKLMSALHGHAADIGWGMNPLNVGPYVSGSGRCVDFVDANGHDIFPFVLSGQQPWSYNSFFSYVTSESSYESEAVFRRSLDLNGSLGFGLADALTVELDGGYSSNSEQVHTTSSSQNSVDFIFSARALGPKYVSAGQAKIRSNLVGEIVDSTSSNQERTDLWLQKCGIGYIDQVRLGAYLRVEMHIRATNAETQIEISELANTYFNGNVTGSGASGGSNQAQGFLDSLNASFSYDSQTESIVGTMAGNKTFSITFDVSSEGPFFNVGPITSLQTVWDLFSDFPSVVQSVNKKYLAAMEHSAKPYNSAINTGDLINHDGSPTGIDYANMADVNVRRVMQEDLSELFFNYQFEKGKLASILFDHASIQSGLASYYEFWNSTTLNDIEYNHSENERISYAAARAIYCLADFTETLADCHYQTFVDAIGFTYAYDLWSSGGVPFFPTYIAPRRIGQHTIINGRDYYDFIMSQGAYNNVVEIDGDSSFGVSNEGAVKKFECEDIRFWQTGWEKCLGHIMYDLPFNQGWTVQTVFTQSSNIGNNNRRVYFSQTPFSSRVHLDMRHKKSTTTPAWLRLHQAKVTGPYNWSWTGLTPANFYLEGVN